MQPFCFSIINTDDNSFLSHSHYAITHSFFLLDFYFSFSILCLIRYFFSLFFAPRMEHWGLMFSGWQMSTKHLCFCFFFCSYYIFFLPEFNEVVHLENGKRKNFQKEFFIVSLTQWLFTVNTSGWTYCDSRIKDVICSMMLF